MKKSHHTAEQITFALRQAEAGNTWDIYEVKGSTSVKDENIHDVSFQRYCAQKAGLEISLKY